MKKLGNFVFALILMVSVIGESFAFGKEHSLFVHVVGEKQIDLHLTDINGRVKLYLADKNGKIYHEERMKVKDEVKLKLDLSDLETGTYTLVLKDEFKFQTVPVIVYEEKVSVEMDKLSKTYFPKVAIEGEIVTIRMISNLSNDLKIAIHSNNDELLFEEELDGVAGLVGKRFKFMPGIYRMRLTSDHYTEVKYLTF